MPYIDLAGLSRYASRQKDRLERDYALLRDMQWTRSEKAGAVSLWPVGGTPLKPVVDFLFSETPPAEGDKGPENPSTIAGVSSVMVGRCGVNLFNVRGELVQSSACTVASEDFLELSGTNSESSITYASYLLVPSFAIQSDKTYTVAVEIQSVSNCAIAFGVSSGYSQRGQLNTGSWVAYNSVGTFFRVCTNNNLYNPNCMLRLIITCEPNSTYSLKTRISVFEGVVDSSNFKYVSYEGNEYTLPLGSTYYGGTVDVSTGVMTVTWHGYAFDGTENWAFNATSPYSNFVLITDYPAPSGSALAPVYSQEICSHFSVNNSVNPQIEHFIVYGNRVAFYATQASLADWKAWLASEKTAGHPLAVTYPLATPYTVQLSPTEILSLTQTDKYTPRLNTVYTDAQVVQVGYVKSPIRDEYELQQAVIAQGGNV